MDPVNPQESQNSKVGQLEQELEDLKKSVLSQQPLETSGFNKTEAPQITGLPVENTKPSETTQPFIPQTQPGVPPVWETPKEKNTSNPIVKFGLFVLGLAVVLLIIYIVKSFLNKSKTPMFLKTQATQTPVSQPEATPDLFSGWKTYRQGQEIYTFRYPSDFSQSSYSESINGGAMIYLLGDSQQGGVNATLTDGIIIKTLLLEGSDKNAQSYAEGMRQQAIKLSGSNVKTTEVSTVSVGNKTGWGYSLEGLGIAKDLYVEVGEGLIRIQVSYSGSGDNLSKYQGLVDKILSSFEFSGSSKGGIEGNTFVLPTSNPNFASPTSSPSGFSF